MLPTTHAILTPTRLWLLACCFLLCTHARAAVTLASPFTDNMVLQREIHIKVWGWANKGEKISVQIAGKQYQAQASDKGEWSVLLDPVTVGGPYTMVVKGDNEITLRNILCGDVWFCSGQSNMNLPLKSTTGAEEAISNATDPNIRLLTIPSNIGFTALGTTKRPITWTACTPATVPDFSAVAYYTGRKLSRELHIPIGLIHCSYGGTIIEDWLPRSYTDTMIAYKDILVKTKGKDEQGYLTEREERLCTLFNGLTIYDNEKVLWDTLHLTPPAYQPQWNTIQLPAFWESVQGLENLDGVAWFYKTINLSKEEARLESRLSLGRISEQDIVFLNGRQVASSPYDRYALRRYTIPAAVVKEGENTLLIRVTNKRKEGGFGGPAKEMYWQSVSKKTSLTGAWQYWFQYAKANMHPNEIASSLYNGMVAPVTGYAIKGFIWYQGESNAPNGNRYQAYLTALISEWRKAWGEGALPFSIIQLPNVKNHDTDPNAYADWAVIRDAQLKASSLPNTSLVTTIDVGEADVHPKDKRTPGERTADQLLSNVYHRDIRAGGPLYDSYRVDKDSVVISFRQPVSSLLFKAGCAADSVFAVAGVDRRFHWAKAVIRNNHLIVWSKEVARPVAVRYAWANNPCVVLYGDNQVPASPFRTDDWNVSPATKTKDAEE